MKLMALNPETHLPEPLPEILLIPVFNKMWTNRYPVDGDRDCKKRIVNRQMFGYLYFTNHYDSRFKNLNSEGKFEKMKKILDIPDEWKDGKLPEILKECIQLYREELRTYTGLELVESLRGLNKDMSEWLKHKREELKSGKMSTKDAKDLKAISDDIPSMIENLKKAEAALEREENALSTGRKGRPLGYKELPNKEKLAQ